jgi:hypothetical protein
MVPVNQVILGGGDPLLGSSVIGNSIEEQLQLLDRYRQNLEAAKQLKQAVQVPQSIQPIQSQKLIWDDIDSEIEPMTEEQKGRLFNDEDYVDTYNRIQVMVNTEILNLVKAKIESTSEGKELLSKQLKIVRKLKSKIISETNKEMELFKKFKEFSKQNPEVTYEEFVKSNL